MAVPETQYVQSVAPNLQIANVTTEVCLLDVEPDFPPRTSAMAALSGRLWVATGTLGGVLVYPGASLSRWVLDRFTLAAGGPFRA